MPPFAKREAVVKNSVHYYGPPYRSDEAVVVRQWYFWLQLRAHRLAPKIVFVRSRTHAFLTFIVLLIRSLV